jgi:hypothetical protein
VGPGPHRPTRPRPTDQRDSRKWLTCAGGAALYDGRVRFLSLALTIAAVGLGGVALAQPSLVVDPWGRATDSADSWFASSEAARDEHGTIGEVTDPWAPRPESTAVIPVGPTVAPLGPVDVPFDVRPLERASDASVPKLAPVVIDPWAPTVPSELPSLARASTSRTQLNRSASPWSSRLVEIIDPWRRVPEWAGADRVRLVVDPWAR